MDPIGTDYTSYNDLTGKISIDFPGDLGATDFSTYVNSLGIDINRYRPFGLEIFAIESSNVYDDTIVRVLAYDLENDNKIVRFKKVDTLSNLLSHIWRLSITVTEEGYTDKSGLTISEEIELE